MKKKKRIIMRDYSEEEMKEAITLAKQIGQTAASKKLGIPPTTLSTWKSRNKESKVRYFRPAHRIDQEKPDKAEGPSPHGLETWSTTSTVAANQRVFPVPKESKEKTRTQTKSKPQKAKPPQGKRKIARVYNASQREDTLERAAVEGVAGVSNATGISRSAIYDWQRKLKLVAEGKIAPPVETNPSAPAGANDRDALVLELWKKHPGLGPTQIRNQLRREKGMKISVHTVRCIMEEHGYQTPKVRRQTVHDQRYEALRPNQLWHQ
jgi:transposase-like protein